MTLDLSNIYGEDNNPVFSVANSDGIEILYAEITSENGYANECCVISDDDHIYSGVLRIPEYVEYDGIKYTVTAIGDMAFFDMPELTDVIIPNTVTNSGSAFYNNGINRPIYNDTVFFFMPRTYQGEYAVPYGIEKIADSAFSECDKITAITLPASIKEVGFQAFYGLESAVKPIITNDILYYVPLNYEGEYTVPAEVRVIAPHAAFGCKKLTSVVVPSTVDSIGGWAFAHNVSLESVKLHDGLRSIGRSAFYCCEKLKDIVIPNTVSWVDHGILYGSGIDHPVYNDRLFVYYPLFKDGSYSVPDGIVTIAAGAFDACDIDEVKLPKTVEYIGYNAFNCCRSLSAVTFPPALKEIGMCAFSSCDNLRVVKIPKNTEIYFNSFGPLIEPQIIRF